MTNELTFKHSTTVICHTEQSEVRLDDVVGQVSFSRCKKALFAHADKILRQLQVPNFTHVAGLPPKLQSKS